MWYVVNSPEFSLAEVPNTELPMALQKLPNGNFKIVWNDEGFSDELEKLEPILKHATKKAWFSVYMEDHKGDTTFKVKFGPNYFEEG